MKLNPELRRYAWLELSLHRLVVVPLVIAALATLMLLGATKPAEPLAFTALGLFMLATVVWGSLRTIASVTEEVRERTWDFQRMAAVPPLQLALGKMLGAPLLYWYIGFWALLVLLCGHDDQFWLRLEPAQGLGACGFRRVLP